MNASITLTVKNDNYKDTVIVKNIKNKDSFSYVDNENMKCHVDIFDDGLNLYRENNEYKLELHLRKESYAKIINDQGELKINTKVVDFNRNNDILVMRYIIELDDERFIEIRYEGDK